MTRDGDTKPEMEKSSEGPVDLEREKSRDALTYDESENRTEREPLAETRILAERKSSSEMSA
jgi:hypothetical protein